MPTVLITGANRGIGLELVHQYSGCGWQVIAAARDIDSAAELNQLAENRDIDVVALDVVSDQQIDQLRQFLQGRTLDLLIHNAGVYGPKSVAFGELNREAWREVLEVNTISPLMVVQALEQNIKQGGTVALVSSKVGSIEDNGSGGGYYYRSSKTALNQVVKSLSIDLSGRGLKVLALHPGWVQTRMGGPNALISAEQSSVGLMRVIEKAEMADSGRFFNYDGSSIPW